MPLDPNIALQARPIQLDNPMDLQAKALQLKQLGLQTDQAQLEATQQRTLADLYRNNVNSDGSINQTGILQGMAGAGLGAKIPAYQAAQLGVQKTQADIAQTNAQTAGSDFDVHKKKLDLIGGTISALASKPNVTHDDVISGLSGLVNSGAITAEQGAQAARELPGRPEQLRPFLIQKGLATMDASKRLEALMPKVEYKDTGGTLAPVDTNPLTNPNPAAITRTQTPDNAANIAKDYAVAGLKADGSVDGNSELTAQAIAKGQLPAPTGMALLNPKNQRVLARVMEINPNYDFTDVSAKKAAATAFTSGKEGAAMRSIGTATKHLDMLGGLVDALDNGNTQLVNRIGNTFAAQTGSTAPTNFDAAKEIVGQEVVKAIVAGGGGVAERAEAAKMLDDAKSPAQLRGVIQTYKSIMGAQHESLLQQRRAAGLSDSTLPDYTEGSRSGAAPAAPVVPIKSDADYNALKSGTRFQAPDGSIRVKP